MKTSDGINAFISGVVLFVVAVTANGAAAKIMWAWFVVPLDVPAIGLAHAIGLVSLMRFIYPGRSTPENTPMTELLLESLAFTGFSVVVGFVVSRFM